ncbi:MAG: hypothetical protein DCC58_08990 [Chloroflexi bacterium]|nr:MAG: hypothetical protein DCC58_08990 [Chloroflexota bacterium]
MFERGYLVDDVPLQDLDLLQRMNQYFASLDLRLRSGQGWVIYNVKGPRSTRLTRFLQQHLTETGGLYSHYFLPWRDFALTAYLVTEELSELATKEAELSEHARREYAIATRVSRQTLARMVTTDLLILNGLLPRTEHELAYLDKTIERRYQQRLSTILMIPEEPHELVAGIAQITEQGDAIWRRLSERLYQTSLIAV